MTFFLVGRRGAAISNIARFRLLFLVWRQGPSFCKVVGVAGGGMQLLEWLRASGSAN